MGYDLRAKAKPTTSLQNAPSNPSALSECRGLHKEAVGDRQPSSPRPDTVFPSTRTGAKDEHDRKGHRSQAGCNTTASGQAERRRRATQHATNSGGPHQWTSETQIKWPSEWSAAFRRPRRSNRLVGRRPLASPNTRDKRRTFASSRRCAFSIGETRERRANPQDANSPDAVVRTAEATDRSTRARAQEARGANLENEQEVNGRSATGFTQRAHSNHCVGIVHTATAILFSCCRLECV